LRELIDNGLDAKNFLNDFLELIYLFGRRINLGPIEKDMLVSEAELELIEDGSQNLNMQDLGLFWQLTLKTIEDLKVVSNENIALEMFLMQLMHARNLEKYSEEKILSNEKLPDIQPTKKKIEENNINPNPINFTKDQMKNTEQIKTVTSKEIEEKNNFEVRSFSDLINLAEKNKEMELKYDLERNVKLVSFENGKIDINFNENLNKNFIKRLSQSLYEWTGKRWIISLSKEENVKTFHQNKIHEKEKILNDEKNSETFKEMLKAFPDVDLIEVQKEDE